MELTASVSRNRYQELVPITLAFALLAIETGTLGYFTIETGWRIPPLVLAGGGILLLLQPVLKLL